MQNMSNVKVKKIIIISSILAFVFLVLLVVFLNRSSSTIHILWVEWQPSYELEKLAKGFTRETGITVVVDKVSSTDWQTATYRDVDSEHPKYDIVMGDSQWLGRNIEIGERYLDLTDFIKDNKWEEKFAPDALMRYGGYSARPGHYYAVPVFGHAMAFAYRKDLFENELEKQLFRERFGYDLAVPQTWSELKDIAEFFNRPKKDLYGLSMPTDPDEYDTLSMSFNTILAAFGGNFGDDVNLKADGYINSSEAVDALAFMKSLYKASYQYYNGPQGYTASANTFMAGHAAMLFDFMGFFPPLADATKNPYSGDTGYFSVPEGPGGHFTTLGGQGASVVYRSKNRKEALQFLKWWMSDDTQKGWAQVGGGTLNKDVLNSPGYSYYTPYNKVWRDSVNMLRDFWTVPEYPELLSVSQSELFRYLNDGITAREALNTIAKRWDNIFKTSPYNILR